MNFNREKLQFNQALQRRILRLQQVVEATDREFAEFFDVSSSRWLAFKRGFASPELAEIENICRVLGISVQALFTDAFDEAALLKQFRGRSNIMPGKYSIESQKRSKIRAVRLVTDYLDGNFYADWSGMILRALQVNPASLSDLQTDVSSQLTTDILVALRKAGIDPLHFRAMGAMTTKLARKTSLRKLFSKAKSPSELYELALVQHIDELDRVFNYRVTALTSDHCRLEISPNHETCDAFGKVWMGSPENCIFRQGVVSSLLEFISKRSADLKQTRCMHWGDPSCIFEITWSQTHARQLRLIETQDSSLLAKY